ncbi:MAG: hypothetical protein K2Q12_01370 [Rickettsiales bacterium]|nr:hypothetical protein [Rickettsiales bacterium]
MSPRFLPRFIFLWAFIICSLWHAPVLAAVNFDRELAYQVRFGQAADVMTLVQKGGNPDQINESGMPLVSVAASRRDGLAVPILRALVSGHANINQGGPSRQFPIIIATRQRDVELVAFLVREAKADLSVRDPNGALPREIAAHNNDTKIIAIIDEPVAQQLAELKARQAPERRALLLHDYIYHYCAHQYLYYYYSSKQDAVSPDIQTQTLAQHKGVITSSINDLQQFFGLQQESIFPIAKDVSQRLVAELERYISNRNRRKNGVGTPQDMQSRCERYTTKALEKSALPLTSGTAKKP